MSSPHYKGSTLPNAGDQYILEKDGNYMIIKPLALDIIWGNDTRYWRINAAKNLAELVQVSWLEVNGSVDMTKLHGLNPNTRYKLEFRVTLKPDAFGWNNSPVYIMVKPPGKKTNYIWKNADLSRIKEEQNSSSSTTTTVMTIPSAASPLEFTTPPSSSSSSSVNNDNDNLITFGLFEIWARKWKGGLVIEEVIISKL